MQPRGRPGDVDAARVTLGQPGVFVPTNTEIGSSLLLQMVMYFNVYFSLAWFLLQIYFVKWKLDKYDMATELQIFLPTYTFLWGVSETLRLLFGYVGNLREKVPHLLGFLLLSLVPHLPLTLYFVMFQPEMLSYDSWAGAISLGFVLLEFILGIRAVRMLVRSQKSKFASARLASHHDSNL